MMPRSASSASLTGFQVFFLDLVLQLVHQTHGAGGADVGQNELFLELVVQIIVDLRVGQRIDDALEKPVRVFSSPRLTFCCS